MARPNTLRLLLPLTALVVAVVGAIALLGGGEGRTHTLYATVPEATNLIKGQELKAGGGKIGVIDDVQAIDRGARARLTLKIEDRAWPLPADTRFTARFGGTAAFYNRHILVSPGRETGPKLADGATIATRNFTTPVEVDELLSAFDGPARRDLKSFINRSGVTFDRARQPLTKVLEQSPPALDQLASVFEDLTDDRSALDTTIARTSDVVDAVHRADPGLSRLLGGAASTFAAIADKQTQLSTTIDRLPGMLAQTRETLGRAQTTLDGAGRLARRIGPGVTELRRTAAPLNATLAAVQDVAPDANATLATVRRSTGAITTFLKRTTQVSPQLGSIGDGAVENLKCIRPYSPEIAGLLTTWADFMSWNDGKDKVLRATVQDYIPANYNSVPLTPAQASKVFSGLQYGFPRPPGYLAGQPWYLPECGAGQDAVDPAKDPEARRSYVPIPTSAKGKK